MGPAAVSASARPPRIERDESTGLATPRGCEAVDVGIEGLREPCLGLSMGVPADDV